MLNHSLINQSYIFILDPTLNNSDLFCYKYVFDNIGLLNYKIITDLSIIENIINDNNIVILSWSSGSYFCYLNNNQIVINKFNSKVINNLDKTYIIYIGDTDIPDELNKPIYKYENNITYLFEKVLN